MRTMLRTTLLSLVGAGCTVDPPIECSGREDFLEVSAYGNGDAEETEITNIENAADGRWRVGITHDRYVEFAEHEERPFIDVEPGPITLFADIAAGVGEGSDYALYEMDSAALGPFLVFGFVNVRNDGDTSAQTVPGVSVHLRKPRDSDKCPTGGGAAVAALEVSTDSGETWLLPAESAKVEIDNVPWHVEAGTAIRTETYIDRDCADCPSGGGWSQNTTIDVLAYRITTP
jgi:hypothetical protein